MFGFGTTLFVLKRGLKVLDWQQRIAALSRKSV